MRKRVYNGMPARQLGSEGWHKPWSGGNGGSCVEAMRLADGRVALRQSTDPDGPALIYARHAMAGFIRGVKAGQADFLLAQEGAGPAPRPAHPAHPAHPAQSPC
ncbi:DUF397 domain-containing protein [Streptomyces sp. S1A]|uniref:DUF397 domain-containing protein n=1 Tax=Streptomyces sp. ICN903 TaxID=2964654 RepID=UPI001EDC8971|nr:DUF397 domain-containing protein [Streptomyces sp. ICN903]MCG3041442.1 DUF397 domain-containing protein [Streptomyces sp. ICN903]